MTIVGGGIVGCATAAACARLGLTTVLLEKEPAVARGITNRNSEVVHGGMHYPAGSLKARCCVRGRHLLKEFCAEAGVGYRECGKLIVAVQEDEIPDLEKLLEQGRANGMADLEFLDETGVRAMEREVRAVAALWSPRTAILDAEGTTRAYAARAGELGAQIMVEGRVHRLEKTVAGWLVSVGSETGRRREGWTHSSRWVINCAGLQADAVAAIAGVDVAARRWRQVPTKGNYFRIAPRHEGRVQTLVYPVPPVDQASLGVHLCLDLAGGLRLGPDVGTKSIAPDGSLAYDVDPARLDAFFAGAVRFLPWLTREDLSPDMAGYRPKLAVDGFHDFVLDVGEGDQEGLINLLGIESPGLTSGPALAEEVAAILVSAGAN